MAKSISFRVDVDTLVDFSFSGHPRTSDTKTTSGILCLTRWSHSCSRRQSPSLTRLKKPLKFWDKTVRGRAPFVALDFCGLCGPTSWLGRDHVAHPFVSSVMVTSEGLSSPSAAAHCLSVNGARRPLLLAWSIQSATVASSSNCLSPALPAAAMSATPAVSP